MPFYFEQMHINGFQVNKNQVNEFFLSSIPLTFSQQALTLLVVKPPGKDRKVFQSASIIRR